VHRAERRAHADSDADGHATRDVDTDASITVADGG
jgi:hypothetical protein